MAEMIIKVEIENEKIQEYVDKALYKYKTESGLTVAECVERQKVKKPICSVMLFAKCPICQNELYENQKYCENCGQALNWS